MYVLHSELINYKLKYEATIYNQRWNNTKQLKIVNSHMILSSIDEYESEMFIEIYKSKADFNNLEISGANQSFPIINVIANSFLTLINCSLTNNSALNWASSIIVVNESYAVVKKCHFEENVGFNGGVIYALYYSSIRISKTTFRSNIAKSGGAIYLFGSHANVSNCTFEGNAAHDYGGAIYATDYVKMLVNYCAFSSNEAGKFGGAIYGRYDTNISISRGTFQYNKAIVYSGGCMGLAFYSRLNVENSTFKLSSGLKGGVISTLHNNYLNIRNSEFISNRGTLNTGVLKAEQEAVVIFKNCKFISNSAAVAESVITAYENVHMVIEECLFDKNESPFSGILVAMNYVNVSIFRSNITGNQARVQSLIEVGTKSNLTVKDSLFTKNTGSNLIYGTENSSLSFFTCNFSEHSLPADPLIVISSSNLELRNSTFLNNVQHEQGAIVIGEDRSKTKVVSCNFKGNNASKGGVFYMTGASYLFVQNSTFLENSAGDGSVAALFDHSRAHFQGTKFLNGNSFGYGGILKAVQAKVFVWDSYFSFNQAVFGGCFYLEYGSSLAVYDSVFENNKAKNGGVVYKYGTGNVSMENCTLTNNTWSAIYYNNVDYLRLSRGLCQNNPHINGNCVTFKCSQEYLCKLYTSNYLVGDFNENISSKAVDFLHTAENRRLISGTNASLETPYASCK